MTSTPVMGSSLNADFTAQMVQAQNTRKAEGTDFKSFMAQAGDSTAGNARTDIKSKADVKSKTDTGTEKSEIKDTDAPERKVTETDRSDVRETQKPQDESFNKGVNDAKDAIEKIESAISEELDVSIEDIENALENLGLTQTALLDVSQLPSIVAEVTGEEDTLSLVTNEELYESLSALTDTVNETVNELTEALNVSAEEMNEAIVSLETKPEPENEIPDFKEAFTDKLSDVKENPKSFEEKVTVNVTDDLRKSTIRNQDSLRNENTANEEKTENLLKTDVKLRDSKEFTGNEGFKNNNQEMTFAQNILSKATEAVSETAESISYTSIDAEDVINQMTEYIKVNVSGETSEISLRLHPESLGNVNVKISANNEGIVTAQFTTQNEAVKAIVESQAVVLKEALEQKGVTVEAVEVLVQSHEFERNLSDQNRESNGGEPKRRGPRRINLSEPETEITDENDDLVKEMMEQNGNTIDYSA